MRWDNVESTQSKSNNYHEELLSNLKTALDNNKELRLCQLLYAVLRAHKYRDLFYTTDEHLLESLKTFNNPTE